MNENDLIEQVIKGNEQAFRFLVKQYERLVFHVACRVLDRQEDLEDLCQEVFIKVHNKLPEFRRDSKLSTWIATIAYRLSVNYVNRKKILSFHLDDSSERTRDNFINTETPSDSVERTETRELINKVINSIPEKYRTVLSLYHIEEYSYEEIGKITGLPEGTVKNYIFRARKLFKLEYEKQKQF